MEEGLNNANNPFGVANGTTADNIITQKNDGLLLNLSDKFKQNGTDLSPVDFFEKSNGKRSASEFEDDDFGPETDVDTVDDLLSPGVKDGIPKSFTDGFPSPNNNPLLEEGVFNPFMELQEKAALEMEKNMRKRETKDDFEDEERMTREETPTPPAGAVHDVSGLVENPADSESEDEWNYIKGEEADKENISPQPEKEVADIPEEDDTMSQLNPNAAEFVPVSPTRSIPSPACRTLINDPIVSQSPKKANEMDISVPNPREFENEVKSRPSEFDSCNNGHNEDDDPNSSKDLIENILNGKNIDEIPEFQPGSTPKKVFQNEEFHFGPNAAPFTPKRLDQSEALSTRAVYGDESEATVDTSFNESINQDLNILNKESDPMSMSFYADQGESNPFDLNKVRELPDNLDEFLTQTNNDSFNETFSDLPEHRPLGTPNKSNILNNDDAIQITDLDKHTYDDEKELASPLEADKELLNTEETDFSKTPEPTHENLFEDFCRLPEKPKEFLINFAPQDSSEVNDLLGSGTENLPPDVELLPNIDLLPSAISKLTEDSPIEFSNLPPEPKPAFDTESPVSEKSASPDFYRPTPICKLPTELYEGLQDAVSPVCDNSEKPDQISIPQPITEQLQAEFLVCDRPESKSSVCDLSESKSPMPEEPMSAGSEDFTRPEFIQQAEDRFEELCQPLESPQEEETSSVKDDVSEEHPVNDSFVAKSPSQNQIIEVSFTQEEVAAISAAKIEEPSVLEEMPVDNQLIENVSTSDLTNEEPLLDIDMPKPVICICPCPQQVPIPWKTKEEYDKYCQLNVRTETISAEFAEQAVVTPSEDSKADDFIIENIEAVKEALNESQQLESEMTAIGVSSTVAAGAAIAAVLAMPEEEKKLEKPKKTPLKPASTAKHLTATPRSAAKSPAKSSPKLTSLSAPKPSPRTALTKTGTKSTTAASPKLTATSTPKPIAASSPKPMAAGSPKPATDAAPKPLPRAPLSKTSQVTKTQPAAKPTSKLTNGETRTTAKPLGAGRVISDPTSKFTTKPTHSATATSKLNQSKPLAKPPKATVPPRTTASPTARPAPATARSVPLSARPLSAPKRPTTLSKTNIGNAEKKAPVSATGISATKPPTKSATTVPPKPRTLTGAPPFKPKVPQTKTVSVTKVLPDNEKQIKESANKITASRNLTQRTTKVSSTRTTVTKSTTSTTKTAALNKKKPVEIVKTNRVSKTETTKIEKPKENGISTVVTEEITVVNNAILDQQPDLIKNSQQGLVNIENEEPGLIKDNSPVDNKIIETQQLVHANAD